MTLGVNDPQLGLRDDLRWFCEPTLSENSIFSVLERENPPSHLRDGSGSGSASRLGGCQAGTGLDTAV